MGFNENVEIQSRIEKGLKLNPAREATPKQVNNSIQPVYLVNNLLPLLVEIKDVALNDSDKTIVVPVDKTWKINHIYCELISTADVGNRRIVIEILDNNDNVLYRQAALNVQAASQTEDYNFIKGIQEPTEAITAIHNIPLPIDLFLVSGFQIRIFDTAAIAATADDLSIFILVEEFDYSL